MNAPTEAPFTQSPEVRSRKSRRLLALIIAGVAVVAAATSWIYLVYARPIGIGPAGPPVPAEAFESPWSNRPVFLVGLGDSITAGFGASNGLGYFDRLVANPPDEFPDMKGRNLAAVFPNLTVKNLALSGSTSLEHVDLLLPKLEVQDDETFGLVLLNTGGNDVIHNYGRTPPREGAMYGATVDQARPWIANFETRLESMLDQITARFPGGCAIFLANIYDPTDGVGDAENAGLPPWPDGLEVLTAYNRVIAEVAGRRDNVHLVDIHREFLGHGIHCLKFWHPHYDPADPRYWYFDNLEDPNDRGYDAIRRLFLLKMVEVLPPVLASN